jgi:nucleotide-binding universal stress UspA family protein
MSSDPASRRDDGAILIAYDGSEHSRAGIREAARQLQPGRRALVMTVWQPVDSVPIAPVPIIASSEELAKLSEADAREIAGDGVDLARSAGFDAEPLVAAGEPVWQRIVESASALGASLVVVGSHGRTGIRLLLMGSVAAATARHAHCAVLIAHIPAM